MKPTLRHIANLWTFLEHPTAANEWPLRAKVEAIADAGFDGVCWGASPELSEELARQRLTFVGGMATADEAAIVALLENEAAHGATHINVQLGHDETLLPDALRLTLTLMEHGRSLGVLPAIETHRGTCTETPEKTYALADAYQQATGELLRLSIDLSHHAVVKHLTPDNFSQAACWFARTSSSLPSSSISVPSTATTRSSQSQTATANLTREVEEWLPFAEDLLSCWLRANAAIQTTRSSSARNLARYPAATASPPSPTPGKTPRSSALRSTSSGVASPRLSPLTPAADTSPASTRARSGTPGETAHSFQIPRPARHWSIVCLAPVP